MYINFLFKKEQKYILIGLAIIFFFSWYYLFTLSSDSMTDQMLTPQPINWSFFNLFFMSVMWIIMMVGMMIPSATPTILVFFNINKQRSQIGKQFVPTWIFVSGYVTMWTLFALLATMAQLALQAFGLASQGGVINSNIISGFILIIIGVYQFTPIKHICLKNCQEPFSFFMGKWKDGKFGAFTMGINHGTYCLGCCWFLISILFVVGVMNLLWIGLVTIFILIEKVIHTHKLISWTPGIFLFLWGLWLILQPWVL